MSSSRPPSKFRSAPPPRPSPSTLPSGAQAYESLWLKRLALDEWIDYIGIMPGMGGEDGTDCCAYCFAECDSTSLVDHGCTICSPKLKETFNRYHITRSDDISDIRNYLELIDRKRLAEAITPERNSRTSSPPPQRLKAGNRYATLSVDRMGDEDPSALKETPSQGPSAGVHRGGKNGKSRTIRYEPYSSTDPLDTFSTRNSKSSSRQPSQGTEYRNLHKTKKSLMSDDEGLRTVNGVEEDVVGRRRGARDVDVVGGISKTNTRRVDLKQFLYNPSIKANTSDSAPLSSSSSNSNWPPPTKTEKQGGEKGLKQYEFGSLGESQAGVGKALAFIPLKSTNNPWRVPESDHEVFEDVFAGESGCGGEDRDGDEIVAASGDSTLSNRRQLDHPKLTEDWGGLVEFDDGCVGGSGSGIGRLKAAVSTASPPGGSEIDGSNSVTRQHLERVFQVMLSYAGEMLGDNIGYAECYKLLEDIGVDVFVDLFTQCCTETGGKIIEYFRGGPRVDLQEVPERHLINKQQHKGYGVYLDGGVPSYFLSGIGRGYSGSQIYTQPYHNNRDHRKKSPSYHYTAGYSQYEDDDHIYVRMLVVDPEKVRSALESKRLSESAYRKRWQAMNRIFEEAALILVGAREKDALLRRLCESNEVWTPTPPLRFTNVNSALARGGDYFDSVTGAAAGRKGGLKAGEAAALAAGLPQGSRINLRQRAAARKTRQENQDWETRRSEAIKSSAKTTRFSAWRSATGKKVSFVGSGDLFLVTLPLNDLTFTGRVSNEHKKLPISPKLRWPQHRGTPLTGEVFVKLVESPDSGPSLIVRNASGKILIEYNESTCTRFVADNEIYCMRTGKKAARTTDNNLLDKWMLFTAYLAYAEENDRHDD